jgi:ketosteroid isomerase-like protein
MKKLSLLFLLSFSLQLSAQNADVKAIQKLLQTQSEAWNRGDIDNFMVGYWNNDSLLFIGKSGLKYGYQTTLANYKKSYPDLASMGQLSFELFKINVLSKDYAFVVGKWFLKRTVGDIGGHFDLLLKKINQQWVIIADHSS